MMIQQAFEIKQNPFPWSKAIKAGFCAAIPALIGWLLGNITYGLQAGIGGFTYLYVFNEPYAQRAKKLFFVLIGMTLSVGLGTLVAPIPLLSAFMVGIIGTLATFIFGALQIPGPAAVFFILGFAMTTGMPIDPTLAPLRAGLVFLGGVLSWVIGMAGWFFKPYAPEKTAVKKDYLELATLLDSVGTESFNRARHRTVMQLKDTKGILLAGYISWRSTDLYKRLILLNEHANNILLEILESYDEESEKLPSELSLSIKGVAHAIDHEMESLLQIRQPEETDEVVSRLFTKIFDADAIMNEPVTRINREIKIPKPSLKTVIGGAFDKNSIVFISALRYGIILTIAALVAYSFDFHRSYWIPLSCAAVMLGSTIIATFHRAIQRTFGTIIGILIASVIFSAKPDGIFIVMITLLLTSLTELFIVKNYALAAIFITPNALLIAESSSQIKNLSYFATARITDIIIGCSIGLIGTLLAGKRSASSRISHLMAKTIRSQMQFLQILFSEQSLGYNTDFRPAQSKMHINLNNLKLIYSTALGEIPSNKRALEHLWPVIFSIEQLGFLLDECLKNSERPILPDRSLAEFLLVFETMANAAEHKQVPITKGIPEIVGFPKIQKEISDLQEAFKVSEKSPF